MSDEEQADRGEREMRSFTGAFGEQRRGVCDECHHTAFTTRTAPFLCWTCERERVIQQGGPGD